MIALTRRILTILHIYRVFIAAVGLTWLFVAIGVMRALNVRSEGLSAFQNFFQLTLLGLLFYLIYASFFGVYGLSRQIVDFRKNRKLIVKLRTETFLAIMINAGISSVIVDHLILEYGTKFHAIVLVSLIMVASSFTRHPFLKRFVNFFRRRLMPGSFIDM